MPIKIKYLDGERFKRSIIASAKKIGQAEEHLNAINVFPVPDGDTGTNMTVTMNSIVLGAQSCHESSFGSISDAIADSALSGARGNSGAILAQFFQGLAEATRGRVKLTTKVFADAASNAVDSARNAISNPKEGTIITVMKDWANNLAEHAPNTHDFVELFKTSLAQAKESLSETPEKLKVLKNAGVVDAGAEGFVNLLEGVVDFIDAGKIAALKTSAHVREKIKNIHLQKAGVHMHYRFCTECLIEGNGIDHDELRRILESKGDSLIVIGSERKVRVHIHTNKPKAVFELSAGYGAVVSAKAEDMRRQHHEIIAEKPKKKIGLVTDSTCDLPQEIIEKYHINIVPVMLQVGQKSYRDRVEIKHQEFYRFLKETDQKLGTSQPPPAHFRDVYDNLISDFEKILSIHLSANLSGTLNAARMGCKNSGYKNKIHIFDSRNLSAGMGLLVAEAGKMIDEGMKVEEILLRLNDLRKNVRLFINLPTLKYVMRSGRLKRSKGILGSMLNLKPVLTVSAEGYLIEAAKTFSKKNMRDKTLQMALDFASSVANQRFCVGHVSAPEATKWYKGRIIERFPQAQIWDIEATPALGVHTGIGSTGIAVLGDPD